MPKRKIEQVEQDESEEFYGNTEGSESTDDSSNQSSNSVSCGSGQPSRKKMRKSVNFENVDVFYFPRTQGFACVPSQGGTTLGMSEKHAHKEQYPLKHYRKMRKIVRRKKADVEESAENSFSIDAINDISQEEIVETDSEEDDTETDGFFLQPVPIRQRRSLLKLSGVKKVDTSEREECKALRENREECGCDCKIVCDPDTCLCAINGIQCQVDRFSFPCGCSRKGCGNLAGRIEFNPGKVRRHYTHTMKRLQSEYEEELMNPPQSESPSSAAADSNKKKKSKHIRFSDEDGGQPVEGEISASELNAAAAESDADSSKAEYEDEYNSTETGCCLDCSLSAGLPAAISCTTSECSDYAAQFSVGCSSPSLSEKLDNAADDCLFGTSSVFSSSDLALPSVSSVHNHCDDNITNHIPSSSPQALQPISGLLNPILNTMDSLDMYALSHIHNHPQSQASLQATAAAAAPHSDSEYCGDSGAAVGTFVQQHDNDNEFNDNSMSRWQSLSHESMLTSNNLTPMNDNECSVSSPESYESSEGLSVHVHDMDAIEATERDCDASSLSFTSLKNSSDLSFQFQTSHNTAMHAMHSQSEDTDPCNRSGTGLTVPTGAKCDTA